MYVITTSYSTDIQDMVIYICEWVGKRLIQEENIKHYRGRRKNDW